MRLLIMSLIAGLSFPSAVLATPVGQHPEWSKNSSVLKSLDPPPISQHEVCEAINAVEHMKVLLENEIIEHDINADTVGNGSNLQSLHMTAAAASRKIGQQWMQIFCAGETTTSPPLPR